MIGQFLQHLVDILAMSQFLLFVKIVSFLLRSFLFIGLVVLGLRSKTSRKLWPILTTMLLCNVLIDGIWIIRLLKKTFIPSIGYQFTTILTRVSWLAVIIYYSFLFIFIERLSDKEKHFSFKKHHLLLVCSGLGFGLFFIYTAIANNPLHPGSSLFRAYQAAYLYFSCITLFGVWHALVNVKHFRLPKIIAHQLKIFTAFLLVPQFFLETISFNPITLTPGPASLTGVTTLFLTYILYYVAHTMLGLRFLNFNNHVQLNTDFVFIKNFKEFLYQLSQASSTTELAYSSKNFFKTGFNIPEDHVQLFVRQNEPYLQTEPSEEMPVIPVIEKFLNQQNNSHTISLLNQQRIFIKDEIEFTHFYEADTELNEALLLMQTIKADIFLPLYEQKSIIGYVIIKENTRPKGFFSREECDEMLVFTNYLSNVINLLRSRNLEYLIQQDKELREELHLKHQEINQYKETLRSFLRTTKEHKFGIIIAQRRRFLYTNSTAEELLGIKITHLEKHPLLAQLLALGQQANNYKTPQTVQLQSTDNNPIKVMGIPCLEKSAVLMVVYQPDNMHMIKAQLDVLKDPSYWDYLLYLETTKSGRLINTLIPGSGETLTNFKIELLKTALSKKATLLTMPKDDIAATVELIHHISLRSTLYPIKLSTYERNSEVGIKLFGINNLFLSSIESEPIVQKLDSNGTIFIENVELLTPETQDHLAEFITYGYFRPIRGNQKIVSDVRIICSTEQDLQTLTADGRFSVRLFHELKKMSVRMPSLLTLPHAELNNLVDQVTQQAITEKTSDQPLALSSTERNKIINQRPISLQEFKECVEHILRAKSTKKNMQPQLEISPVQHITDPTILQAARLGKHALKDKQLMTLLWNKMKNQASIAQILGVNRSSVNRRFKIYNLLPPEDISSP